MYIVLCANFSIGVKKKKITCDFNINIVNNNLTLQCFGYVSTL